MEAKSERKFDYLWIVLFLIVFINGFEAGGYQASLLNIGQSYDLSMTTIRLCRTICHYAGSTGSWKLGRPQQQSLLH